MSTRTYSIYHDVAIDANKAQVFEAVSDPDNLVNWWPLRCSGLPEAGQTYNFYFTPEYDWIAEVTACQLDEFIHYRMVEADEDWTPTSFGFDLETNNEGVLLKFWHTGWPSCNEHFRRSSFCWALLLQGLKNYVEQGVIIPFPERA
mgnify:FL=1